ncbi:hypothetical protein D3C87_679720 [compost metagenome]
MGEGIYKKEIIIVSESIDTSTNKVIEWLHFYQSFVNRKNVDSDFTSFNISIENNGCVNSSLDNTIIWNRRGYLPLIPVNLRMSMWIDFLKKEQYPILSSFEIINNENYTGSYTKEFLNNKITNLLLASKAGLDIPRTLVTNNKKDLLEFIEDDRKYITKCIYQESNIHHKGFNYLGAGTTVLNTQDVPDTFAPSLVQECIEKEVELRIFYFQGKFFAMAIFSQQDDKTKIDFRNYNREKPNRISPFILPDLITEKLEKFIEMTESDTGSIDIILTPKKDFIFLEVNQMGQYDWVSEGCNYYIDKYIAKKLNENAKK